MADIISTYWLPTLVSAVIAYLLGSINFAIPVTKIFIGQDIRTMGSGNAGFTNVLRCVGKPAAIITFIGDFAKGICALFIGEGIFHLMVTDAVNIDETAKVGAAVAGFFALLGHLFPLYFGFKGGKGIVVSAGIMCALDYKCFLIILLIFLIIFAATKTVSKGSITAAIAYPIVTLLLNLLAYKSDAWLALTIVAVAFGALVIFMHRENIKRIMNGTEPKTVAKKADKAEKSEVETTGESDNKTDK